MTMRIAPFFLLLLLLLPLVSSKTTTPNTGDQAQSFLFSFTTSNLVLPITYTCPTPLTLSQLTATDAASNDPVAPYTMVMLVHEQLVDGAGVDYERIYSASLGVGDMSKGRSISHPWGNGTQFIACIWASNAASGGCQDLYTVVPSADFTAEAYQNTSSTCRSPNVLGSWVTPTDQTLDVDVTGVSGDVSWNAWPGSCTDLKFTPRNGTAPYTLLIAPAAHPPVNITSASGLASDDSMNYTIRLTHGQAFMVGMYDSAGNSWAFGPLHAGASDDLSCLAVATGQEESITKEGYGTGEFVGGVVGAFVVGVLGAWVTWWLVGKRPTSKRTLSNDDYYSRPRPASHRTNSGSMYAKTLDSPQIDFDTPATLYDPHVSGPGPAGYPQPQRPSAQLSPLLSQQSPPGSASSARDRDRVFPRPTPHERGSGDRQSFSSRPHDPFGSESEGGYRDTIGLVDFSPTPGSSTARPGSIASARSGAQPQPAPSGAGHQAQASYSSLRSDSQSPIRDSSATATARNAATSRKGFAAGPAGTPSPLPQAQRDGSLHSLDRVVLPGQPGASGSPDSTAARPGREPRNVYVVHSDGGGDVHIQLPERGANVIELPPNYRRSPSPPPPPLPEGAATHRPHRPHRPHGPSPSFSAPAPSTGPGTGLGITPYPYLWDSDSTRSRASGVVTTAEMSAEELRARAEAAMREKERVLRLA